ncbi:head-tail connector protein [Novosphingopyxis sp.]|uniref:head-tail connector protein n=1 Tax=Novosphingopyxis sp. TaxID=2709690 RepID=UPI003B58E25B
MRFPPGLVTTTAPDPGPAALASLKQYLRISVETEDAALGEQLRIAYELCERFLGVTLIVRDIAEVTTAGSGWHVLTHRPVIAIDAVDGLLADGPDIALPVAAYALDIAADGGGRIRIERPGAAGRVRVRYNAGIAGYWDGVPEPLRQGIVRLAAHGYSERGGAAPPPAAVAALWRPYRRMVLA